MRDDKPKRSRRVVRIDQDGTTVWVPQSSMMRVASESTIHAVYDELVTVVGSERFYEIVESVFAEDFVYTEPDAVLFGRDAFSAAVRSLGTIGAVDRLQVSVRDLGSHAVVTGACALRRHDRAFPVVYVFNAMWGRVGGRWRCVAQRGASTLLSERPVGR